MPTSKPRVSITLESSDLAVIDRYAAAVGEPRASVIADFITSAVPQLDRACALMELAKAAPAKVKRQVVQGLSNATTDALGLLDGSVDEYKALVERVGGQPQRASLRRAQAAPASGSSGSKKRPSDPHLLTGGSKS